MAKRDPKQNAPIWTRPAPGTRQPKLTREQIAEAALAIADREGFEAVSMRRVAAELGVGTMTLYYYVKTKDDLLTLMDDAIMAEIVVPPDRLPRSWRDGLVAIAHATRDVYLRHPWALRALQGARVGPNSLRHIEQSLAVVAGLGGDLAFRFGILAMVDDYVFGYAFRAGEVRAHPFDAKVMTIVADFMEDQLASGEFPHVQDMFGDGDIADVLSDLVRWFADDSRFDIGLTALLDGLERRLAAILRPRSARDRKRKR